MSITCVRLYLLLLSSLLLPSAADANIWQGAKEKGRAICNWMKWCSDKPTTPKIPVTPPPEIASSTPSQESAQVQTTSISLGGRITAQPCEQGKCDTSTEIRFIPPIISQPFTTEPIVYHSLLGGKTTTASSPPSSSSSNNFPWWIGLLIVVGVFVILGAWKVPTWVRRSECRSPELSSSDIKLRPSNVPRLRLKPDLVPEYTSPHLATINSSAFDSPLVRTIPIAKPTKAECVIELKSYFPTSYRTPHFSDIGSGVHSGYQDGSADVPMDVSVNLYNSINDTPNNYQCWEEDRVLHEHVSAQAGDPIGSSQYSSSLRDITSVHLRPPVPIPPQDSAKYASCNVRENSLYENAENNQHVYATPSMRSPGTDGIARSAAAGNYIHVYEEPPCFPSTGMVTATSTDFLFNAVN